MESYLESNLESYVNISHLVCELNERENQLLKVVGGGWVGGGGCTEIITSALLLLFLN